MVETPPCDDVILVKTGFVTAAVHLRDFYSVWQLTFNKHLISSCFFSWSLDENCQMPITRHTVLSVIFYLFHWQQRWELMPYRRALYIQRVLRCKSIRDGARQYIFIVEPLSGLPARDLLQRETEHSSTISNQGHYWARLSLPFIFSVSPCVFLWVYFSSPPECQEANRHRFNIKRQTMAMDVWLLKGKDTLPLQF